MSRLVLISDTHTMHRQIVVPEADILVHAGDVTYTGKRSQYEDFAAWLNIQSERFKYVVFVAGNHDFAAEHTLRPLIQNERIYFLNDQGLELDGIKFWGSPYTPRFGQWAFMENRGRDIRRHWELIPTDTDVLITHGPPFGILDESELTQGHVGCEELEKAVGRIQPNINVFGHIHGAYGHKAGAPNAPYTDFYNAGVVNEDYKVVNEPWVVDISTKGE